MAYDIQRIRSDFPILRQTVHPGVQLVYLDSAATSQKPEIVIEAMGQFYRRTNANIHRGVHALAEESTALFEQARSKIAHFVNAASSSEIVFTRNTTEALNLIAHSWGRSNLTAGDVVVLTEMEHHSNLVPWQMLADEKDIRLEFIPLTENGLLDLETFVSLLSHSPKLVSFSHMSNVLGTITSAGEITKLAHEAGAVTVLDAAQSVPHMSVDVQELGVDFMAFSAHKMCGPTGIGVLYGKHEILDGMPPFLGGGDMIKEVKLRSFRPNAAPHKFEAGTPAIAEAIGFGAAVDYLASVGMQNIFKHEHSVLEYAIDRLEEVPGLRLLGPSVDKKGGVVAFSFDGVHPHDVAQILDRSGIAVRAGHHCAQPLHERYGLPASTRASFHLYSTRTEVDALIEGLYEVKKVFA